MPPAAVAGPSDEQEVITHFDQLLAPFFDAGKPPSQHLIGVEAEKFGIDAATGAPLQYDGPDGVTGLFQALQRVGWQPVRETARGPVIALTRGIASITLEPGAQLELSGTPWRTVHEVAAEFDQHLTELATVARPRPIHWLACGFHPLASSQALPWVPKQRYGIMREYFPTRGRRGLDMMRRTATVQVNLDYTGEADAMRKLKAALKLAPVVTGMFANAPFSEGRPADGQRSLRAQVWLDVDPDRTGLLPGLVRDGTGFADYVEWALDVPMFLFKRGGQLIANTGQNFRSFWRNGFRGYRATQADWQAHLNTLFPEVRLKRFLEVRCVDALPRELTSAVPALWAGLLYDERALAAAERLTEAWPIHELEPLRHDVARRGLDAWLGDQPVREIAEQVVEIARGGLWRRGRVDETGQDESQYLEPLVRIVQAGQCPADRLLSGLRPGMGPAELRQLIIERTKL